MLLHIHHRVQKPDERVLPVVYAVFGAGRRDVETLRLGNRLAGFATRQNATFRSASRGKSPVSLREEGCLRARSRRLVPFIGWPVHAPIYRLALNAVFRAEERQGGIRT